MALEVSYENGRYRPNDSTGWQFTQTRSYVTIDTGEFGVVALIPMGMAEVSSVTFVPNLRVGRTFDAGDELGHFLFGGSDFVMLFQEEAGFQIDAPVKGSDDNGDPTYEHRLMGELYGTLDTS